MYRILLMLLWLISPILLSAQKKVIDTSDLGKWPFNSIRLVSFTGKFIAYYIDLRDGKGATLYIRNTQSNEDRKLPPVNDFAFCKDDKSIVYRTQSDSLYLLNLESKELDALGTAGSIIFDNEKRCEVAGYQLYNSHSYALLHLPAKQSTPFTSVKSCLFYPSYALLIREQDSSNHEIIYYPYSEKQPITIWRGRNPRSLTVNKKGDRFVFIGAEQGHKTPENLYLYSFNSRSNTRIATQKDVNTDSTGSIHGIVRFSNHDSIILVNVSRPIESKPALPGTPDIYHYKDAALQSLQLKHVSSTAVMETYSVDLITRRSKLLNKPEIQLDMMPAFGMANERHLLASQYLGDAQNEWNWNSRAGVVKYVVDIAQGRTVPISKRLAPPTAGFYILSPFSNHVVYYEPLSREYYTFDIETGKHKVLTNNITVGWTTNGQDDVAEAPYRPIGYAGWMSFDSSLLIYSKSDIVKVFPAGGKPALNITQRAAKNTIFRTAVRYSRGPIPELDYIILTGFDTVTKEEGIYKWQLKDNSIKLLIKEPRVFVGADESTVVPNEPFAKSDNCHLYVIRQMSATEFPNYYYTHDFENRTALTELQPEKSYNWYRTKLIRYQLPSKHMNDGILYLPENFDSTKKYPCIVYYYEKVSSSLHKYIRPTTFSGPINIPYFVSNGYIVFSPDIHYKIGYPGQSIFDIITTGAKMLQKLPYIDGRKIGIQGHSRGGWQTNYLVTHTGMFAAAVSAAGMAEYVHLTYIIRPNGAPRLSGQETGSQRLGCTLWDNPQAYIDNSPLFRVNHVTTPILLQSNRSDTDVPFEQGLSLFIALRRLQKPAWLLQYDEQDHSMFGPAALDYTIRVQQFFDHFLKGNPAPAWMTKGIPAVQKGQEEGLAFGSPALCSPHCAVCQTNLQSSKGNTIAEKP